MKATDVNAPARLRALKWTAAIGEWERGNDAPIVALLTGRRGMPDFAREFVADLAAGTAQRREQGRPGERTPEHERRIWRQVMEAMDAGANQADACADVTARQGLEDTPAAVRGIVAKMRARGLTRAFWLAKMRPR
jgi:hypothetical protein